MQTIIIIVTLFLIQTSIRCQEKFCSKDRRIILSGIFNFDKYIFAYSFAESKDNVKLAQKQIVWTFQYKDRKLIELGKSSTVEALFPGIQLFRTGFGLKLKCGSNDTKCNSYNGLVFIFFQTSYKVFRFITNKMVEELDPKVIPWGLKPRGDAKAFEFGINMDLTKINGIAFMSGENPLLFVAAKAGLYCSPVVVTADKLKWTQLMENKGLTDTLGAFVLDSYVYYNLNAGPDGLIMKFDRNGKAFENTTVWKFFNCIDLKATTVSKLPESLFGKDVIPSNGTTDTVTKTREEANNDVLIVLCLVVAVLLSNTIAGIFWFVVLTSKETAHR